VEILSSLRRRWILTCFMFILTLAGAAFAYVALPWAYQSQSSIVFLSSKLSSKAYGNNPYLAFNSSLNQTADVIRYQTMDAKTVAALASRGYTSTYQIQDALDTAGPVLLVTVTGSNKAQVEHTLHGVTRQIDANLNALQNGIAPTNQIQDMVVTFMPNAVRVSSKKSRPLTIIVGAGLALTVAIPVLVDAVLLRRRDAQGIAQIRRPWTSAESFSTGSRRASSSGYNLTDRKRRVEDATQSVIRKP
jgi:capsular polysaccharide biosynthesis protein